MAIAGPAVSLMLGAALLLVDRLVFIEATPVAALVGWLGWINLVLGVFNLLPGFPMDGGRVLRSILWALSGNFRVATRLAASLGRGMAFLLIAAGAITILQPAGWPLTGDPIGGLWLIIVGLFLNNAAGQTQRQVRLLDKLRGFKAEQLLQEAVPVVAADSTIREFVYDLPNGPDDVASFVTRDGRIAGLLPRDRIRQVPAAQWGTVTASDIMVSAEQIAPANPDEDAAALLQRMDAQGLPALPVVRDGTVAGLVTRAALFRLLRRNPRLRFSRL
jgi:predicted transcriptional regulator